MSANATNSEEEFDVAWYIVQTGIALRTVIKGTEKLEKEGQDMTRYAQCLDSLKKAYNSFDYDAFQNEWIHRSRPKRALEEGVDSLERPEKKARQTNTSDDSYVTKQLVYCNNSTYRLVDNIVPNLKDGYFVQTRTLDVATVLKSILSVDNNIFKYDAMEDGKMYVQNIHSFRILPFSKSDMVFVSKNVYAFVKQEEKYKRAIKPYETKERKGVDGNIISIIKGNDMQIFYDENIPLLLGDHVQVIDKDRNHRVGCIDSIELQYCNGIEVQYCNGNCYDAKWYCLPEGWVAEVTIITIFKATMQFYDKKTYLVPVGSIEGQSRAEQDANLTIKRPKQNYLNKEVSFLRRAMQFDYTAPDKSFDYYYQPYSVKGSLKGSLLGTDVVPVRKGDIVARHAFKKITYEVINVINGRVTIEKKTDVLGRPVDTKEIYKVPLSELRFYKASN